MSRHAPRWDGDDRGTGIGDGSWIEADLRALPEALSVPDWVAEDPELHLLPHLDRACSADGSRLALTSAELRDTVYEVTLGWSGPPGSRREIRAAVYSLLGEIAESVSFVRQRAGEHGLEFVACTGMLHSDGPFAGHGHLLHITVRNEKAES
jgi:hypothetical protein